MRALMLQSVATTVYQFEWWHLPFGLAILLIGASWLAFYAAGFFTALDISRRCASSARNSGLDARLYARLGTLFSILSIGLGIYLLRQLQSKPTPSLTIRTWYAALFVAWLAIILIGILSFDPSSRLWILIVPVGFPLWIIAITLPLVKQLRKSTGDSYSRSAILPAFTYILPFTLSFLCSALPGLILIWQTLFGW